MTEEIRRLQEQVKMSDKSDPAKIAMLQEAEARLMEQLERSRLDGYVGGMKEESYQKEEDAYVSLKNIYSN